MTQAKDSSEARLVMGNCIRVLVLEATIDTVSNYFLQSPMYMCSHLKHTKVQASGCLHKT